MSVSFDARAPCLPRRRMCSGSSSPPAVAQTHIRTRARAHTHTHTHITRGCMHALPLGGTETEDMRGFTEAQRSATHHPKDVWPREEDGPQDRTRPQPAPLPARAPGEAPPAPPPAPPRPHCPRAARGARETLPLLGGAHWHWQERLPGLAAAAAGSIEPHGRGLCLAAAAAGRDLRARPTAARSAAAPWPTCTTTTGESHTPSSSLVRSSAFFLVNPSPRPARRRYTAWGEGDGHRAS